MQLRQAKTEIVSASKVAYQFIARVANNTTSAPDSESPENSSRGTSSRFQGTWFKNLITNGAKPSSSSEIENQDEGASRLQQQHDDKSPLWQNSQSRYDM